MLVIHRSKNQWLLDERIGLLSPAESSRDHFRYTDFAGLILVVSENAVSREHFFSRLS
jgi:hypothetical protein